MGIVRNPDGKFRFVEMTEEEFRRMRSDDEGVCLKCGATRGGCEPDARCYPCDSCGDRAVYAPEELLIRGRVRFV